MSGRFPRMATLRRTTPSVAAALVAVTVLTGALAAPGHGSTPLQIHNPQRIARSGKPLSCPDPSVIRTVRGKWRYFLVCTSDRARNAFPIWKSRDLVHWHRDGYVFPRRRQPYWARHSTGRHHGGLFWSPSIYRIENRWTVYFAAQYNRASHALRSANLHSGAMVLGVATSQSLAGPWHPRIIHYSGQFNSVNPRTAREVFGGDIDPAVVRDPRTGRLYIFWAHQRRWIWEGALSPDGLTIAPHIQPALGVTEPWECNRGCTIEGPVPIYNDGKIYVLYSAASTWNASYKVGVAASIEAMDPAQPFVKRSRPILQTANGFLGPGGTSAPVDGPDGESLILYHALIKRQKPDGHNSAARMLMIGRLNWVDGWPLINHGGA